MKHGTRFWDKKLGRSPQHRAALLRNLISSLITHEKIETTVAKAKFMKRATDLMIEKAKKGHREELETILFNPSVTIPIVMDKLVPRYQSRQGGYTRILFNGTRSSGTDRAPLAIVELVDNPKDTIYHLAKLQLPTIKEQLTKVQSLKYLQKTIDLVDPVSGEPHTVTQYQLKPEINERTLRKLNTQERGISRTIKKYERALSSYPRARSLEESLDKPEKAQVESVQETESPQITAETEPEPVKPTPKKSFFDIFGKLGFKK